MEWMFTSYHYKSAVPKKTFPSSVLGTLT